jgi:hypothetical protein
VALTSDTGVSPTDKITSDGRLTATGVEPGATVQYSTNNGSTWTSSFTAVEGSNSVKVRETDVAGNLSVASAALAFTLDTTPPAAPAVSLTNDTGISPSDRITSDGRLTATGLEPGATVQYRVNSGSWSSTYAPVEGSDSVELRQADVAGNAGPASAALAFTLYTIAPPVPAAPDLQAACDSGVSNTDNITSVTTLTFDVAAAPYFRFYRNSAKLSGDYQGGSSFTTASQAPGSCEYRASAVDAAGNESARSGPLVVTIDTQAPVLTGYSLEEDLDTPGDQITSDRTPVLSFVFSEAVHGINSDVSASGPSGSAAAPDSISGWGTSTVRVAFTTALVEEGAYTVALSGTAIRDAAGNPLGGANVTRHFTITASPSALAGTPGDDSFTFTAGSLWHEVVVELSGRSAAKYLYSATGTLNLTIDGRDGNDRITIVCGAGGNFALLRKGSVDVTGPDYQVHGISVESIQVVGNGGGGQSAHLYDSAGDDTLTVRPNEGSMVGPGYSNSVSGFDRIYGYAAGGGTNDQAHLYDSAGNDTLVGSPAYASMSGAGYLSYASGFDKTFSYATPGGQDVARLYGSDGSDAFTADPTCAVLTDGTTYSSRANDFAFVIAYAGQGGTDAAALSDSEGNDTFTTTPAYATMTGKWRPEGASADRSFYNRGEGFDSYEATSTAGADLARLTDSPASDDQFVAEPTWATLSGSGLSSRANNFRYAVAYATGGNDTAQLKDSPGTDTFIATPAYGVMYASASALNPAYLNRAGGFDQVEAVSASGGDDSARLYDSAGDDNFTAYPTYVLLANDPSNPTAYSNKATGFRYAHASASGGGTDKAWLYDSSGNDTFAAYPTYAVLSNSTAGQAFYNRANYFDQVVATSSGGADIARFFDSALKDVFTFRAAPNDAVMTGSGYLNQALNFRYVSAYATTGDDEANLYDSGGDDKFYGSGSIARLYDAALAAYLVDVRSFQKVNVFGSTGTNTRTIVRPIDYALTFSGTWVGDPWP